MNAKKLMVLLVIFCLCASAVWSQKSISTVYNMDIIVATNDIRPETTSMLIIAAWTWSSGNNIGEFSGCVTQITSFNGTNVNWAGIRTGNRLNRRGIIIPSGAHALNGSHITHDGTRTNASIAFRFQPGGLYLLRFNRDSGTFVIDNLTNNVNWSPEREQMERIIQRHATPVQAAQPAQGTRPATQPAQGDGLHGAVNRAVQALMNNPRLSNDLRIAVFGLTGDEAQFIQRQVEVILVNNDYQPMDRARLNRVREEQRFQLGGEVDEDTAVSIGRFAGAQVVITGEIITSQGRRFLQLSAINAETSLILAAAMEAF
jgi:hypothetical protein